MQRLKDFFLPHLEVTGKSTFCGITTSSHEGVVDTAAEGGLIGSIALKRFCHALSHRGLKIVWTQKQSSAKGVGGSAAVLGVALLPIGLGGENGVRVHGR